MRLQCNCFSAGCGDRGGVELEKRTYDAHARKDKIAITEKARDRADRAIQDELDAIAVHLASTTLLADNLAPASSAAGGRLWSRQASAGTRAEKGEQESASRQEVIRNLLARLDEIDSQVDTLSDKVCHELAIFNKSHNVDLTFPLRHLKAEFLQIEVDLNKITLKAPSVTSLKFSVQEKMDKISEKLHVAKSDWAENLATARSFAPAEESGVKVSTGIYFFS